MNNKETLNEDAMSDFRNLLEAEFDTRRSRNPNYSLRAFSRALNINDSTLSQILRGKRKLTRKMVIHLGAALGLSPEKVNDFLRKGNLHKGWVQQLSQDEAQTLSLWHYDAILEFAELKDRPFTSAEIAKSLRIPVSSVERILADLKAKGYIEYDGRRAENLLGASTTVQPPETEVAAARAYQRSLLDESRAALEHINKAERDHTSLIIAMSKEDLPVIRDMIKQCRRRIMKYINDSENQLDEIFAFQFSAFPISQQDDIEENITGPGSQHRSH